MKNIGVKVGTNHEPNNLNIPAHLVMKEVFFAEGLEVGRLRGGRHCVQHRKKVAGGVLEDLIL